MCTYETYCVPDRTITDNISFIHFVIDVCKSYNYANFAFVCLNQEEAFHRVDRSYFLFLHSGLLVSVMDFWLGFCMLYSGVCWIAIDIQVSYGTLAVQVEGPPKGSSDLGHPPTPTQLMRTMFVFLQEAREMFSICRSPCPCVKRSHLNGLTGQKNEALLVGQ